MASAYSQPLQYTPYQDQYNKELLLKALDYRQNKYDTNRQRIKDAITTTVGIDLIKEEDQEYLYGRLQDVVNVVNQYGSGDLSLDSRADYLTSYISQVADDSVMNGYIGTLKYQNILKGSEKAKEEGTFNQDNFDYSMRDMVNWVNDGKIGSPYYGNSSYVPYTDINAMFLESFKLMEPEGYVVMEDVDNYTYFTKEGKQITKDSIKNMMEASVLSDPNVQQQMQVNSWAQFRGVSDSDFSNLVSGGRESSIKQLQSRKDQLVLEQGINKGKLTEEEYNQYSELIKQFDDQIYELKKPLTQDEIIANRSGYESLFYRESLLDSYADAFAYNSITGVDFITNQGAWKREEMNLKEQEAARDSLADMLELRTDIYSKLKGINSSIQSSEFSSAQRDFDALVNTYKFDPYYKDILTEITGTLDFETYKNRNLGYGTTETEFADIPVDGAIDNYLNKEVGAIKKQASNSLDLAFTLIKDEYTGSPAFMDALFNPTNLKNTNLSDIFNDEWLTSNTTLSQGDKQKVMNAYNSYVKYNNKATANLMNYEEFLDWQNDAIGEMIDYMDTPFVPEDMYSVLNSPKSWEEIKTAVSKEWQELKFDSFISFEFGDKSLFYKAFTTGVVVPNGDGTYAVKLRSNSPTVSVEYAGVGSFGGKTIATIKSKKELQEFLMQQEEVQLQGKGENEIGIPKLNNETLDEQFLATLVNNNAALKTNPTIVIQPDSPESVQFYTSYVTQLAAQQPDNKDLQSIVKLQGKGFVKKVIDAAGGYPAGNKENEFIPSDVLSIEYSRLGEKIILRGGGNVVEVDVGTSLNMDTPEARVVNNMVYTHNKDIDNKTEENRIIKTMTSTGVHSEPMTDIKYNDFELGLSITTSAKFVKQNGNLLYITPELKVEVDGVEIKELSGSFTDVSSLSEAKRELDMYVQSNYQAIANYVAMAKSNPQ